MRLLNHQYSTRNHNHLHRCDQIPHHTSPISFHPSIHNLSTLHMLFPSHNPPKHQKSCIVSYTSRRLNHTKNCNQNNNHKSAKIQTLPSDRLNSLPPEDPKLPQTVRNRALPCIPVPEVPMIRESVTTSRLQPLNSSTQSNPTIPPAESMLWLLKGCKDASIVQDS